MRFVVPMLEVLATVGTLVIVIPTADGVVVAADGLMSVHGRPPIRTSSKLQAVPKSNGTVFAITGYGNLYPEPTPGRNLEEWLRETRPLFNADRIVRDFLSNAGDVSLQPPLMEALGAKLADALARFLHVAPELKQHFIRNGVCRVVVVRFEPLASKTAVGSLLIGVNTTGGVEAVDCLVDERTPEQPREVFRFGQTEYVDANVLTPGSAGFEFVTGTELPSLLGAAKTVCAMRQANA